MVRQADREQQGAEAGMGTLAIIVRLLSGLLVAAGLGIACYVYRQDSDGQMLLPVLAGFSAVGVFYLVCSVFGVCRFMMSDPRSAPIVKLLQALPEAIVITDRESAVRYMNASYHHLASGRKQAPDLLFAGDEAAIVIDRLLCVAHEGRAAYGEVQISTLQCPAGYHHWKASARSESENTAQMHIFTFNISLMEVDGEVLYLWLIVDVTLHRQQQERQFEDLAQAINHLDQAPVGFVAWDQFARITYLNATLAGWIGFDLATQAPESLTLSRLVGAQYAHELQKFLARNRDGGCQNMFELDLFHENGKRISMQFHLAPFMPAGDRKEGVGVAGRAVLVRNRVDEADGVRLKKPRETSLSDLVSKARLDLFADYFHSCPIALVVVDANGLIQGGNQRFGEVFCFEFPVDGAPPATELASLIVAEDGSRLQQLLARALTEEAGDILSLDTRLSNRTYRDREGEDSPYVRMFIRRLEHDKILGLVGVVETSEQHALEQHMEQGQKMQAVGQLAGGIAHDFNNVLTAILMSCDLLLSSHRRSDPSHPDIMNIRNNAYRAASLVRQLLAFSRRQTLRPEILDVSDMLADLRLLLTRLVGISITVKIEHGRDLWPIKADRSELERALINLATNARDAMPGGGILTIRSANMEWGLLDKKLVQNLVPGDYVRIDVADSGIGMTGDIVKKIFEPFFTTKDVGRGTGLGLSMVYGIITQTGGTIACDSTPGQGTCFSLYLPRCLPEREEKPALSARSKANMQNEAAVFLQSDLSGSASVLVVEDEDGVRAGSVKALQSRGYKVFEAGSGVDALEIVRSCQGKIDIIVSDVVMPEMDGPSLLKELRFLYPHIKFIFVSGYAEDAFSRNLPEDARFAFLPKPFSLKQLALTVKEMLEDRSQFTER